MKFENFVNCSGKYHVQFEHFVNFFRHNFRAKISCFPKLTELLRLCVELVSKISNLCDHNPPTLQTDRRTDGRHAMANYGESCGKINGKLAIESILMNAVTGIAEEIR